MPVRVVVDGRTAQISLVNPGRGVLVVEEAGHKAGVAPPPLRRKEPELVLQDRAAERSTEVVDIVDGTDGGQATCFQVGRNARAVQAVIRVTGEGITTELVASRLRHEIDLNAAQLEFRRVATELDRDLLGAGGIEVKSCAGIPCLHRIPS